MFSRRSDASKIALVHLARYLDLLGFAVIDCQMTTSHLLSLGAREIARSEFASGLAVWTREGMAPRRWPASDGRIVF